MSRIYTSAGKFIVGENELRRLAEHLKPFPPPFLLVASEKDLRFARSSIGPLIAKMIETDFSGECTAQEISRISALCKNNACSAVIGLGGGKAIDTAKCAANDNCLPVIVIPTIAATDAPCSRLAVIYDANHRSVDFYAFAKNPDMVIADSSIIAAAPIRYLIAGMGDAFATYYEARACMRSGANSYNGAKPTIAAFALAEACLKVLLRDGKAALNACAGKTVTHELENIIEANILLSGIGFESGGLAVAHELQSAFTLLPETADALHGERVAIGTLVQLIMENSQIELADAVGFYKSVGLPLSFAQIGMSEPTDEKLRLIAEKTAGAGSDAHNMPFEVTTRSVFNALKQLDEII